MSRPDALLGRILADRYRIERELGRGGMGVVYVATDQRSLRSVAVKVLLPVFAQDPDLVGRFFQEAKTAGGLRHENVIDVFDTGTDAAGSEGASASELAYIAMELLEGESLEQRLKREKRLAPEQVLRALLPVISALSLAHERGIIHRDLKPENVFLARVGEREVPKLLDFGIAKLLENSSVQTATGSTLGTPGYMSPEQMRGVSALTAASDVWGMGVILFRALAGRLPYEVDPNPTTMIMHILMNEAPRLRALAPDVPEGIASAVDLALKHSPETRHRDMDELLEALVHGAQTEGVRFEDPRAARSPSLLPPGVI